MKVDEEFSDILKTEWSYKFEELMKQAMIMSYHKYGALRKNHSKENNHMDAIANLKKRLEKYEETGNTEFLVDVANFAMIEFVHPQHENAHFKGTAENAVELVGFGVNQIKDEIEKG